MRLPNFLIIGANKAGTTSLYRYLQQHPEIYMSPNKEPMFFTLAGKNIQRDSGEQKKVLGGAINNIEDYKNLFSDVTIEKAVGEASTAYLANPECADLIMEYIPNVKLIAILRNPVERAFSNYRMYKRWGFEKRSFAEAVSDELSGNAEGLPQGQQYLKLGEYGSSLRYFYKIFAEEQIQIFLFEDFLVGGEFFKKIFRFLEVDNLFQVNASRIYNASDKNILKKIFTRIIGDSRMEKKTRKTLIDYFRNDINLTERIIRKPLQHWLE